MRVSLLVSTVAVFHGALTSAITSFKNNLNLLPPSSDAKILPHINVATAPSKTSIAYFDTYLDHKNKSAGTFPLRYYYNDEYYGGPGSPVLLFAGQEGSAGSYAEYFLTNISLLMEMGQAINAAVIVIEHRYWGESSPYSVLSTQNLTYLTLQQNIDDLTYFAENVRPPFDPQGTSKASVAPWVLYGGSYSGAVTGWVAATAPGTFWAYFASSAVVEVISNFYDYFTPERLYMPANCSSDLQLVVQYLDNTLLGGTPAQKKALKAMFGLEGLNHDADFAEAIVNGPYLWQGNQFYANAGFFDFCDWIENANLPNSTVPGKKGVGLSKALQGYSSWFSTQFLPGFCESYGYPDFNSSSSVACFNSFNASSPIYTDTSVGNPVDRQWYWMLCNEPFGYWQTGAPAGQPSIVSRLVNVAYNTRQCSLFFPPQDGYKVGVAKGKTEDEVNEFTGGWNVTEIPRLFFVNGEYDPWRYSTVSSDSRPGGRLKSTKAEKVAVIPGGFHCSDAFLANGEVNAGVRKVQDQEVAQLKKWIAQFPKKYPTPYPTTYPKA